MDLPFCQQWVEDHADVVDHCITVKADLKDQMDFMDLDDFGAYPIYVRLVRFYRLGGQPDVRLTKGLRAKLGQVRQVRFSGQPDMGRTH
jgi:hypothetical protein